MCRIFSYPIDLMKAVFNVGNVMNRDIGVFRRIRYASKLSSLREWKSAVDETIRTILNETFSDKTPFTSKAVIEFDGAFNFEFEGGSPHLGKAAAIVQSALEHELREYLLKSTT